MLKKLLILILFLSTLSFAKDKYLIINADDFGMHPAVNKGIIKAYEAGMITSISIMMPCPAIDEVIEYIKANPNIDIGIHLTLTSEWKNYRWKPILSQDEVPSLYDDEGYMWNDILPLYKYANKKEVEKELIAQIEKARNYGINITHLDCHMGWAYYNKGFLDIYLKLAKEYNLPVRLPTFIKQEEIVSPDNLIYELMTTPTNQKRQTLVKILTTLKEGINEIVVHPVYPIKEIYEIIKPPLDANARAEELNILLDEDIKKLIQELNIKLIGYSEIRN